jgi:TPR repeat protein
MNTLETRDPAPFHAKAMQSTRRRGKRVRSDATAGVTLRTLRARAGQGDAAAQSEVARRLSRRNKLKESLRWFRAAARGGDPEHQMDLGVVLCWDLGAYRAGLKWILRAAEQGHIGAQYFLGAELATGENVRKKLSQSAYWYGRAAAQGHSEAQYNLALMYWSGEGVRRSKSLAHHWLEKAASSRESFALRALAEAYEFGQLGYRKNRVRARYWRDLYNRTNKAAGKSSSRAKAR